MSPSPSPSLFGALFVRDLRLALFPLGVGPEPQTLRQIAPGVIWVCALLAAMLSVSQLYSSDHADGTLEQLLMTGGSTTLIAAARAAAHWTLTGLPLVVAAPLFGLLFDLSATALRVLALTLLLGTPVLSLLGSLGAALTLGLRSASVLVILIVLPLSIPVLIFGSGAVAAVDAGQAAGPHLSLLGALLIVTALGVPPATAAALRISTE